MRGMSIALRAGLGSIRRAPVPVLAAGLAFLVLYWEPMVTIGPAWWNDPYAGHGLLLVPLAVILLWRRGIVRETRPQRLLGVILLVGFVLMRYLSGLAAELFTMRLSVLGALAALVVFAWGWRQLAHWWLPAALLTLSIPIPTVLLNSLALPLQLKASQMGATLLEWRHVPVALSGNVIHLPERSLFVTEACSGLRSLTALFALAVLIGGLWLQTPWTRILILIAAVPVAMALNGVRIFGTGFLVHYVDPSLGEGFMHYSEGWVLFVFGFGILGCLAWLMRKAEQAFKVRSAL